MMSWFGMWDGFDEKMQGAPDIFTRKPQTNGDRVRAMTDEELAVICEDGCPPNRECPPINREELGEKSTCQQCWLNWLKQEVKDNG